MNRCRRTFASIAVIGALCGGAGVRAQVPPPPMPGPPPVPMPATGAPRTPAPPVGEMKPLGGDRYQIGRVVVDKRGGTITVPGRIHVLKQPLEYLATARGGMKQYESLLEVDATGSEFNLACILLGLERDPHQGPFFQFSQPAVVGPRVEIDIGWAEGGKRRKVSAAEALLDPAGAVKPESVAWVYTGSMLGQPDGQFAADVTGTLIGFVHDANTVIESSLGLGIGAYGSVDGNSTVLPPVDTPIELTVTVTRKAKAGDRAR
jgi:hypothetical protein